MALPDGERWVAIGGGIRGPFDVCVMMWKGMVLPNKPSGIVEANRLCPAFCLITLAAANIFPLLAAITSLIFPPSATITSLIFPLSATITSLLSPCNQHLSYLPSPCNHHLPYLPSRHTHCSRMTLSCLPSFCNGVSQFFSLHPQQTSDTLIFSPQVGGSALPLHTLFLTWKAAAFLTLNLKWVAAYTVSSPSPKVGGFSFLSSPKQESCSFFFFT